MFCVSHGLKGPNVCVVFASFFFDRSFTTDLLEAAILQTHECKSRKGWVLGSLGGSPTLEKKLHPGAARVLPPKCTEEFIRVVGLTGVGAGPLSQRSAIWVFHLELFT